MTVLNLPAIHTLQIYRTLAEALVKLEVVQQYNFCSYWLVFALEGAS